MARAYDAATGQVYMETQVPVTSMVSSWPNKCNGARQDPRKYRHAGRGSSSLYRMALRTCAYHIDLFTPTDLQCAEWHYAKAIYEQLKKNQTLTANAWSVFQQAFPDGGGLEPYPIRIPAKHGAPAAELPSIQQWLRALPFAQLSLLNIQSVRLQVSDLILLTHLPNLGVLLLRHPYEARYQDLDDRAMRDWGRAVEDTGTFTQLKVVVFHCFAPTLAATLKCLAAFPALKLCSVDPCKPIRCTEDAERQVASAAVPFQLLRATSERRRKDDSPDAIWTNQEAFGHTKMKLLYDLAVRLESGNQQQAAEQHPSSAVLSVYYGAELHFAYSTYPLWFERTLGDNRGPQHTVVQRGKHHNGNQDDDTMMRNENSKRRKVRSGKQSDIGSLLGNFG